MCQRQVVNTLDGLRNKPATKIIEALMYQYVSVCLRESQPVSLTALTLDFCFVYRAHQLE